MERELLETFEAAKKAADAAAGADDSPEADRCLDAMRRLRGLRVTTDVLVSTQVSAPHPPSPRDPNSCLRAAT
jgi:transcription elongation factor S-II